MSVREVPLIAGIVEPEKAKRNLSELSEGEMVATMAQMVNQSKVSLAKAKFDQGDPLSMPAMPERPQQMEEQRLWSPRAVALKPKIELASDALSKIAAPTASLVPKEEEKCLRSPRVATTKPNVDLASDSASKIAALTASLAKAKAKFDKEDPIPKQTSSNSTIRQAKEKFDTGNPITMPSMPEREWRPGPRPRSAKSTGEVKKSLPPSEIFVQIDADAGEVATEKTIEEDLAVNPQAQPNTPRRRRKRVNSIGLPKPVVNELEETLGVARLDGSTANDVIDTSRGEDASEKATIRPLRPSLKDTPSIRSNSTNSFAQAAEEVIGALQESISNDIAKNNSEGEVAKEKVLEAKVATTKISVEPQAKTIHVTAGTERKPIPPPLRETTSTQSQDFESRPSRTA